MQKRKLNGGKTRLRRVGEVYKTDDGCELQEGEQCYVSLNCLSGEHRISPKPRKALYRDEAAVEGGWDFTIPTWPGARLDCGNCRCEITAVFKNKVECARLTGGVNRNRVQLLNPVTAKYVKLDTFTGSIIGHKKSRGPYSGIPVLKQRCARQLAKRSPNR